jgi:arabinose-5-phosphate isomerase
VTEEKTRAEESRAGDEEIVALAREVLEVECASLEALAERVGGAFVAAARAISRTRGTVILSGVGKSGIVARKIAATFASTGTPAAFLHPADAAHGDIGLVAGSDVVVAVSKSGEGDELLQILPILRDLKVTIIAITGNPSSSLASLSDIVLDASVEREACPLDLVPTASTTAAVALGDALAVVVMKEKEVGREDFAYFHPGGALGRRLLLRVRDVMHTGEELPVVTEDTIMREAIVEIANKRLGLTTVVDRNGKLVGILTDGDLKRILIEREDILAATASEVMSRSPKTVGRDELVAAALEKMETLPPSPITSLVIVDAEGRPEGVIHIHDCLKAVR